MRARESFADQSVLVTGGTGFIGRRLVSELLAAKARVTVLHRAGAIVPEHTTGIAVPDWTPENLASALGSARFEGVFNLAAYGVAPRDRDAELMYCVNVSSALALFEHASRTGARFFIQAGSAAEYAPTSAQMPIAETAPLEIQKLYGASKAQAGARLLAACAGRDIGLTVARIFNVYGPGEGPHRLSTVLWKGLSRGERVPLSPGVQVRDLLHVDDVARGLMALADSQRRSPDCTAVNLCSGEATTVAQFSRMFADAIGASHDLLGLGDTELRPDDLAYVVGSTEKLFALTGWRPRLTLSAGIAATIGELT